MSVVITGGHDCMVSQYRKVCRNYKCKTKVLIQMSASLDKQIGSPDLLVLLINTVSHKMIHCALDEVGSGTEIVHCHTSSDTALTKTLEEKYAVCAVQASQSAPLLHLQHLQALRHGARNASGLVRYGEAVFIFVLSGVYISNLKFFHYRIPAFYDSSQ